MLTPVTAQSRHRGRPLKKKPVPPPVSALTLVAAEYNHDTDRVVILTFDRPAEIGGLEGNQIVVDDADDSGLKLAATGAATLDSPNVVRIVLNEIADATGTGTTLTAGAGNGIVAVDDAGAWAGVTDLNLPFP